MFKSLKARITLASIVISALSLIALASVIFIVERNNLLSTIDNSTNQLSETYASKFGQWVDEKRQLTHAISDLVYKDEPIDELKLLEKAGLDLAYFVRSDGSHAFTAARSSDYDGRQRDWYKQTVQAGQASITPAYEDSNTGDLVVSLTEPVMRNGRVYAVVASDLELGTLANEVNSIRPYTQSAAFVVNQETGRIIMHPDQSLILQPVSRLATELSTELLQQIDRNNEHALLTIDGEPQMVYAQTIEGTPWILGVSVNYAEATRSLNVLAGLALVVVLIGIVITSLLMYFFVNRQLGRLITVRDALTDIAVGDGDLTHRLSESGQDELTQISGSFNQFANKITAIFLRIRQASESVNVAATEIAAGSQDLASRTEEQASALAQTAATMEQLTATIRLNSDHIVQANRLAQDATTATDTGQVTVNELFATMNEINQKSEEVGDIVGVIDSIAFQTNILALNAAVEAARAGESGRGFAVVASEVRALAQRSAASAREIRELIEDSVQATHKGNQQAHQAIEAIQAILTIIRNVSAIMNEISTANTEQTTGIEEINIAVSQMDDATHQNASLVEQSATAAQSLQEQAHALATLIGSFKLDDDTPSASHFDVPRLA